MMVSSVSACQKAPRAAFYCTKPSIMIHRSVGERLDVHGLPSEVASTASCTAAAHVQTAVRGTHRMRCALRGMAARLAWVVPTSNAPNAAKMSPGRRLGPPLQRRAGEYFEVKFWRAPAPKLGIFDWQRESFSSDSPWDGSASGAKWARCRCCDGPARVDGRARSAGNFVVKFLSVKR